MKHLAGAAPAPVPAPAPALAPAAAPAATVAAGGDVLAAGVGFAGVASASLAAEGAYNQAAIVVVGPAGWKEQNPIFAASGENATAEVWTVSTSSEFPR